MHSYERRKALNELLEAISKGIELLSQDRLTKDLYTSYEKYISSTLELLKATNYGFYMSPNVVSALCQNSFNLGETCALYNSIHHEFLDTDNDYKNKLKLLLQNIISVLKEMTNEY